MLKQRIIFSLFFIYSSFLISEDDNVEVDLLFLKIQELESEIAELRNILESQDYLIQKLIQESVDDLESNEDSNNIASDNTVRFQELMIQEVKKRYIKLQSISSRSRL